MIAVHTVSYTHLNEDIEIPRLGDEIIDLLLSRASENFDWSAISPTIFGAVFESCLLYTSVSEPVSAHSAKAGGENPGAADRACAVRLKVAAL